jgi:hypothetical protein
MIWRQIPTDALGTFNILLELKLDKNVASRAELHQLGLEFDVDTLVFSQAINWFPIRQMHQACLPKSLWQNNIIWWTKYQRNYKFEFVLQRMKSRFETQPECMTQVESRGLLTWVYHIGYSTLLPLVWVQKGICKAHEESSMKPKPRNLCKIGILGPHRVNRHTDM